MKSTKLRKIIAIFLMTLFIVPFIPKQAFAATIGQQLTSAEEGWQRIDDSDSKIQYTGTWLNVLNSSLYNGSSRYNYSSENNKSIKFKFIGSKIRLIQYRNGWCNNCSVKVDGIERGTIELLPGGNNYQTLTFELLLEQGLHQVEIYGGSKNYFNLDAIDIDDNGYLIDPAQNVTVPTNLVATQNNSQIDLSWNAVTNATGYNIKRATTSGGPYTTIATNIATTTYADTSVENNVTYYYVVSAINGEIESPNSNEVSASVIIDNTRALLSITMINGAIKEYDLSITEVTNFINWFDARENGTGKAYYTFTKIPSIQPYKTRLEYIIFDKINYFEVNSY